ncbi:DgyrCDS5535 [Dimorphilus gyrociliatus]|uniref:DgyrCDS5535 n=1 Tax=Dimorphilus gyrociliatus TaxID=2664684 RepID=A0A7I8VKA9_9ANNE|nr:DgyrCDS5535 [Dimorphilus gyrociliatus]
MPRATKKAEEVDRVVCQNLELAKSIRDFLRNHCNKTITLEDALSSIMKIYKTEKKKNSSTPKFNEALQYLMYNAFEFGDMESDFINKHWDLFGAILAEITVLEKSDVINPVVRNVIRHYFSCQVPEKELRWHTTHICASFLLHLPNGVDLSGKFYDKIVEKLKIDANDKCPAVRLWAVKGLTVFQCSGEDIDVIRFLIDKAKFDGNLAVRLAAQESFCITSRTASELTNFILSKNAASRKLAFSRLGSSVHIRALVREYRQKALFYAFQESEPDVKKHAKEHLIEIWKQMCCSIEQLVKYLICETSDKRDFNVLNSVLKTYNAETLIEACFENLPSPDTRGGIDGEIQRNYPPLLNDKLCIDLDNITFVKAVWWSETLKVLKAKQEEGEMDLVEKITPSALDFTNMIESFYYKYKDDLDSGRSINEDNLPLDYIKASCTIGYLLQISEYVDNNDPVGREKVYKSFKELLLLDSTCYDWCGGFVKAKRRFALNDEEFTKDIFYIISEVLQPFSENVTTSHNDETEPTQAADSTIRTDHFVRAKVLACLKEFSNLMKESTYDLSQSNTYQDFIKRNVAAWVSVDTELPYVRLLALEIIHIHANCFKRTEKDLETAILAFVYNIIERKSVYHTEADLVNLFRLTTSFLTHTSRTAINDTIFKVEANCEATVLLLKHCGYEDKNLKNFDPLEFILDEYCSCFYSLQFEGQCEIINFLCILLIYRRNVENLLPRIFDIVVYDHKRKITAHSLVRETVELVFESEIIKSNIFVEFVDCFTRIVKVMVNEDEDYLAILIDIFCKICKHGIDKIIQDAETSAQSLDILQQVRLKLSTVLKAIGTQKDIERIVTKIEKSPVFAENEELFKAEEKDEVDTTMKELTKTIEEDEYEEDEDDDDVTIIAETAAAVSQLKVEVKEEIEAINNDSHESSSDDIVPLSPTTQAPTLKKRGVVSNKVTDDSKEFVKSRTTRSKSGKKRGHDTDIANFSKLSGQLVTLLVSSNFLASLTACSTIVMFMI